MYRKVPNRRTPVKGYLETLPCDGFIAIREKPTETASERVIVAHTSAWKAVRKVRGTTKHKPQKGYCFAYHDRLLFNGDGAIVCSREKSEYHDDAEVIIVPESGYKVVRRANVKPLAVERPVPTPHKSHRMTPWRTEIRSPGGTPRFYGVRHCKRCELEQMHHAAGRFSPDGLSEKCKPE